MMLSLPGQASAEPSSSPRAPVTPKAPSSPKAPSTPSTAWSPKLAGEGDLAAEEVARLAAEKQSNIEARVLLIREMRSRPKVCATLGLPTKVMDQDLLLFLAQIDDFRYSLRRAGCLAADAIRISSLLPGALAAPTPKEVKPPCTCRCMFVVFCMITILALICLAIWIQIEATAGWYEGVCNIVDFGQNSSCYMEQCTLAVTVRQAGSARKFYVGEWPPPLEKHYREERITMVGEPFRCCDLAGTLSCCQLLDTESMYFCDHWPWLVDSKGNPCPDGNWRCLFRASTIEDSEVIDKVEELKVHDSPVLWPCFVGIGIFALLALCTLFTKPFKKCCYMLMSLADASKESRAEAIRQADEASGAVILMTAASGDNLEGANSQPEGSSAMVAMDLTDPDPGLESLRSPKTDHDEVRPTPEGESQQKDNLTLSVESLEEEARQNLQHGTFSKAPARPDPPVSDPPKSQPRRKAEDGVHPAFWAGDLSHLAKQPVGELLQPIIAPLPEKVRAFRSQTTSNAGIAASRVVSPSVSHPASYAPSQATSRAVSYSPSYATSRVASHPGSPGSRGTHLPSTHPGGVQHGLRMAASGSDGHESPHAGSRRGTRSPQGAPSVSSLKSANSEVSPVRSVHSSPHGGAFASAVVRGGMLPAGNVQPRTRLEA